MPVLNPSELNIVVSVAGGFLLAFGIISVKLKQTWYLGEACKLLDGEMFPHIDTDCLKCRLCCSVSSLAR